MHFAPVSSYTLNLPKWYAEFVIIKYWTVLNPKGWRNFFGDSRFISRLFFCVRCFVLYRSTIVELDVAPILVSVPTSFSKISLYF